MPERQMLSSLKGNENDHHDHIRPLCRPGKTTPRLHLLPPQQMGGLSAGEVDRIRAFRRHEGRWFSGRGASG